MTGEKKRRIFALLLTGAVVTAGVWGSNKAAYGTADVYGEENEGGSGWTIMLYLCGTDLETDNGFASINLEEICNADLPGDVNVVIETGGTSEWQWDGIDPGVLGRYHVENGDLNQVDSQPSASMGEVSTLVDFVNWGVSNYPSQHYGLIMWDHGGGSVDGVCYDQLYDNDNLDMPELGQAMSQMPVTLDMVGFDACLMGSMECAKMMQRNAKYMVASEETEPGYGWNYTAFLDSLAEDTSMGGDELGRIICDSFYDKCDQYGVAETATLSVIDLSKIDRVNMRFDSYTSEMAMATQDMQSFGNVAGGVERAESFGGNTPEEGYCNLVDLVDMVNNTSSAVTGVDDGSGLIGAIQDAVLYEVHGEARANANGLAVYYPLEIDQGVIDYYHSFSENVPYLQYIAALSGNYADTDWEDEYAEYGEYELDEAAWDEFMEGLSSSSSYDDESYEDDSYEDDSYEDEDWE